MVLAAKFTFRYLALGFSNVRVRTAYKCQSYQADGGKTFNGHSNMLVFCLEDMKEGISIGYRLENKKSLPPTLALSVAEITDVYVAHVRAVNGGWHGRRRAG